jgi:thiamine biosynthesis protein ThiS
VSNPLYERTVTDPIPVTVNGEPKHVPPGLNVLQLLGVLEIDPSRVAVELNRSIVHKADWPATSIGDGAQIEIVWFVGGG